MEGIERRSTQSKAMIEALPALWETHTAVAIANQFGVSRGVVNRAVYELRKKGELPKNEKKKTIKSELKQLTPDEALARARHFESEVEGALHTTDQNGHEITLTPKQLRTTLEGKLGEAINPQALKAVLTRIQTRKPPPERWHKN
ncbi:MAG TPA: hypothetical protein VE090_05935 [Methylomirabilota bacterium]|nr:hypothetical protein [Methylomirabilota bacterium]